MEKKAAKSLKPKRKAKQLGPAASSVVVATALKKHWPDDAGRILQVMTAATSSASFKKKLGRCVRALDRLRQKEGA